jgi:hypothetical protein
LPLITSAVVLEKRQWVSECSGTTRRDPRSLRFRLVRLRRDESSNSCGGHRTREHCALSATLTVSQLSKSFAGRALFDDVSLQVNRAIGSGWSAPMEPANQPCLRFCSVMCRPIRGRSRSRKTLRSDFFRRKPPFKFEKRCQLSSAATMNRFRLS